MLPARILLVSANPTDLAFMSGALSGYFPVLSANTTEEALELMERYGPCGMAFCQIPDSPKLGVPFAEALCQASPGIAIIALTHLPCPDALLRAAVTGIIHSISLLPMTSATLRDKARHVLSCQRRRIAPQETSSHHLTREEVNFLLGHEHAAPGETPHHA